MVTEDYVYTQLQAAFPDVAAEHMRELTNIYVRKISKQFKPLFPYTWIEIRTIAWVKLRTACGVFVSGGQVHNVLDSFHQAFPLMAVVRQNSNFGNYSVNAIMYYPELLRTYMVKDYLLGMDDPKYLRMRDRLMQLYDSRRLPEPAIRIGPQQMRKLVACAELD